MPDPTTDRGLQEGISRVIAQLTAAVTNTGLYAADHPQVAQYADKAYGVLTDLLALRPEITVLLIGDDLVADQKPLPAGAYVTNFVRILKRKAIERLSFAAGLSRAEFGSLIHDLASPDAAMVRSTAFIKLGKVELRVRTAAERAQQAGTMGEISQEDYEALMALSATELNELKDLYVNIKKHRKIDVRGIDDIVKSFVSSVRQESNPLSLLASLKSAHEYTFTHVTNVGILTMSQAEALGFKGEQLHQIGIASLLHDVGKLFVPAEILSKPGKLTPEERSIIETHTVKGARYLMGLDGIPKVAVLAAMEHHMKYDGTGYPTLKGGWRPGIVSQIIAISDVFDAMRSRRSYQEPLPIEKITEVLKNGSGKSFNPALVEHFLKLIRR